MATQIFQIDQAKVINTLDTFTHTAKQTAPYTVTLKLFENVPSGVTLAIQKNGSDVITSGAPTSLQSFQEIRTVIACVPTDTLSVILSSSNNQDTRPNQFKGILTFSAGSTGN